MLFSYYTTTYWTACVRYLLLFPRLYLSLHKIPPSYHQRFLNVRWQFKLITYGYELPVTDASEPNKQIYKKCSVTKRTEALHNISQFVVYDITLKLLLITLTSLFSLWRFRGPSRSLYFACRESTGNATVMARCQLSKWKSRTLFQLGS